MQVRATRRATAVYLLFFFHWCSFNVCASILGCYIVYIVLKLFACMNFFFFHSSPFLPSFHCFSFFFFFFCFFLFVLKILWMHLDAGWAFLVVPLKRAFVHNCNRSWIHLMSMNTVYVFSLCIQVWIYELKDTYSQSGVRSMKS